MAKAKKRSNTKKTTSKNKQNNAKKTDAGERTKKEPLALAPVGTQDVLGDQREYWNVIEQALESIVTTYQFNKMSTPLYEEGLLIKAGLGAENKIVKNKLIGLTWPETSKNYVLRPELRVGMARAYLLLEKEEDARKPQKYYALGPVVHHHKKPDGQHRNQATHLNFEIYDSHNPVLDAQLIQIAWKLLRHTGLTDYRVHINSTGCSDCRPSYFENLKEHYEANSAKICRECRGYIKKNPLRVLECQEEKCQRVKLDAPQLLDSLCQKCNDQLKGTLEYLDEIEVLYELQPNLIGKVDYLARTVFSILPEEDKENDSEQESYPLFTGGRYNELVETLGGLPTAAVGITGYLERIVRAMQEQQVKLPKVRRADVYLAQLSERAKKKALDIFDELRLNGIRVVESFGENKITEQIEHATELGVRITLILGQKEMQEGTILLRDMENGIQENVDQSKVISEIKRRLQEEPPPESAVRPQEIKHKEKDETDETKEAEDGGGKKKGKDKKSQTKQGKNKKKSEK